MPFWSWPSDYPDECPPSRALPANGVFYRIVKSDPPWAEDFTSTYHRQRSRTEQLIKSGRLTQCVAMGMSVWADVGDAVRMARQLPRIGDLIAQITLVEDSGKILPIHGSYASHHTWWVVRDYAPETLVTAVIPVGTK